MVGNREKQWRNSTSVNTEIEFLTKEKRKTLNTWWGLTRSRKGLTRSRRFRTKKEKG